MVKIMRSNYDKPHRCPTWSGPAWKGGGDDCESGSFASYMYYKSDGSTRHLWQWRFFRCSECGVIVLPVITKWVDPSWIKWRIEKRIANWKYELELMREREDAE